MSAFDNIISKIDILTIESLQIFNQFEEKFEISFKNYNAVASNHKNKLMRFLNDVEKLSKPKTIRRGRPKNVKNVSTPVSEASEKETHEKTDTSSIISTSIEKPKRMASQVASLMINKQAHQNNKDKMRRPSESKDLIASQKATAHEVIIKIEKDEIDNMLSTTGMMLPPSIPLKQRKLRQNKVKSEVESSDTESESTRPVRSNRSKTRNKTNKHEDTDSDRPVRSSRRKKKADSDIVILPDTPVPCISILETDSEGDIPLIAKIHVTDEEKIDKETPLVNEHVDKLKEKEILIEKESENINIPIIEPEKKIVNNKITESTTRNAKKDTEANKENEKNENNKRQKHERSWSSEDDDKRARKCAKKATKKIISKKPGDKVPFVALQNIKKEIVDYENALSYSKENIIVVPETPKPCDQTYQISHEFHPVLNETITFTKSNVVNSTFSKENTLHSPITIPKISASNTTDDANLLKINGLVNCVVALNKIEKIENKSSEEMKNVKENKDDAVKKGHENKKDVLTTKYLEEKKKIKTEKHIEEEKEEKKKNKIKEIRQCKVSIEKDPIIEKISVNEAITVSTDGNADVTTTLSNKENRQWQKPEILISNQPLLTDDESDISPLKDNKINFLEKTPKQNIMKMSEESSSKETPKDKLSKPKKGVKTKPMFSPYANSPVKKRVAAFETLGSPVKTAVTVGPATRITRTKTRKMIEEKENDQKKASKIPSTIKPVPSKYATPLSNNKLKSLIPHSDLKPSRPPVLTNKQNISTIATSLDSTQRSQSAIKLTRAELQERREEDQKKKIEKEDETKRKKDAMMQAKIEESKRIREEKMKKAQNVREERERQKEEKLRHFLAEKEEKLREESERKKALLAQKAAEIEEQRKIVEQNRIARQKEEEEQRRLMQYKKQQEEKAKKKMIPPMPTADNYDTDSSEESERPRVAIPRWGHRSYLFPVLNDMMKVPVRTLHTFFNVKPTTPDLEEIFKNIPKKYLKRNSSAVWRTPPRYSTLPKF